MAKHLIEVVAVNEVKPHPNADKLDIVRVNGWWTVVPKGTVNINDKLVFIPPFSIITEEWAEKWNISKYCPPCPKSFGKREPGLRVMATSIRNFSSYGCLVPLDCPDWEIGKDVSEYYNIRKYEPPYRINNNGKKIKDLNNLKKYNSIDNLYYDLDMFSDDDDVVVTEKVHGTNCVVGYIKDINNDSRHIYVCSSHENRNYIEDNITLKLFNKFKIKLMSIEYNEIENYKLYKLAIKLSKYINNKFIKLEHNEFQGIYALPLQNENIRYALKDISERFQNCDVLIYGEIYGNGIQDMTYGTKAPEFIMFDISINGRIVDYDEYNSFKCNYNIKSVTELYKGKYDLNLMKKLSTGFTTICYPFDIKENFKEREGIVIKPTKECKYNNSRKISKLININYYNRNNDNATEYR